MIIETLLELIKIHKEECFNDEHSIILGFELFDLFKEEIKNKMVKSFPFPNIGESEMFKGCNVSENVLYPIYIRME